MRIVEVREDQFRHVHMVHRFFFLSCGCLMYDSWAPSDTLMRTDHGFSWVLQREEIICVDCSLMHYSLLFLDYHGVGGLPAGASA